jgi:hypothetical protein
MPWVHLFLSRPLVVIAATDIARILYMEVQKLKLIVLIAVIAATEPVLVMRVTMTATLIVEERFVLMALTVTAIQTPIVAI